MQSSQRARLGPFVTAVMALLLPSLLATVLPPVAPADAVGWSRRWPVVIGVASFNTRRGMTAAETWHDRDRLTNRRDLSVIGWQEAERYPFQWRRLKRKGWVTKRFVGDGREEVALSWRATEWSYVSSSSRRMHHGSTNTPMSFGPKYVERVVLRHRRTGRSAAFMVTHVNSGIEDLDHPGHARDIPNAVMAKRHFRTWSEMFGSGGVMYTVGMCDCNVDFGADLAVHEPGFLADAFAGRAVSSYQALGLGGLRPSHDSGRFIDYVFLAASDYRREADFRAQATLGGYNSDHRPVLARIVLH